MKNVVCFVLLCHIAACSQEQAMIEPAEVIAFTREGKMHMMNPDGSNVRRLGKAGTTGYTAHEMAWSADGRMIAYSDGAGLYAINIGDSEGKKEVASKTFSPVQPSWSPDGNYLAFTYFNFPSFCASSTCYNIIRIFVASMNGPDITPTSLLVDTLKTWQAHDMYPAWSPDGKKILFCSNRATVWDSPEGNESNLDLYIMCPDGTGVVRLTESPFSEIHPAWSRDGKRIAFEGWGNGNNSSSIYVMNADGTDLFQVTYNLTQYGHYPTWSPDGTRVAFASDHEGNSEIYVINIDGTGLKRLTNDPREDRFPVWSPGGIEIR